MVSINIVQCDLAKADPSPGLAKCYILHFTFNDFLFREQAPTSSKLNAVDLYLVVCVFFVFCKLSIFTLAIHNYLPENLFWLF